MQREAEETGRPPFEAVAALTHGTRAQASVAGSDMALTTYCPPVSGWRLTDLCYISCYCRFQATYVELARQAALSSRAKQEGGEEDGVVLVVTHGQGVEAAVQVGLTCSIRRRDGNMQYGSRPQPLPDMAI